MAAIRNHAWEHWGQWNPMAAKEKRDPSEISVIEIDSHRAYISPSAPSALRIDRPMAVIPSA
jgi:hypothetical protein